MVLENMMHKAVDFIMQQPAKQNVEGLQKTEPDEPIEPYLMSRL